MLSYSEQTALDAINAELKATPCDWHAAELMAFCQIESSFNPHAYRAEPRIGDASYGLMQTLVRTARGVGFTGAPTDLYRPEISVHCGLAVLIDTVNVLGDLLDRDPETVEIVAAYNAGPGAVAHHVRVYGKGTTPVPDYVNKWQAAYDKWANILEPETGTTK